MRNEDCPGALHTILIRFSFSSSSSPFTRATATLLYYCRIYPTFWVNQKYQVYPKYPTCPRVNKVSFKTSTRPEPTRWPTFFFNTRPKPAQIQKKYPLGPGCNVGLGKWIWSNKPISKLRKQKQLFSTVQCPLQRIPT